MKAYSNETVPLFYLHVFSADSYDESEFIPHAMKHGFHPILRQNLIDAT